MNRDENKHTIDDKISFALSSLERAREWIRQVEKDLEALDARRKKLGRIDLTNRQAAAILGVSENTVMRMKKDGRLASNNFIDVMNAKSK